jgi:Las1-like
MVRDWFYPQHVPHSFDFASLFQADHRQDAINLVSLWHFRDAKLDHALISTANLTDALLHDQAGRREQLSSLALRSIYAMTFCRFVNTFVDRDVRKCVTATIARDTAAAELDAGTGAHRGQSSMYAHALALGLPETFVELRHQATHNEMPSLEVLRLRTQEALEWLWERWWKFNVKGSAEPALSEWLEKHGKGNLGKGRVFYQEQNSMSDQSLLRQRCHKRKCSSHEEDEEDDPVSREEAERRPHSSDGQKQQKSDSDQERQGSVVQRPQGWVTCFS